MPKYPKNHKDVEFYAHNPKRKRRIAGSTKATNDFLVMVHNDYPNYTIGQLKKLITDETKYILFPEAVEVLDAYIKIGEKDLIPKWR